MHTPPPPLSPASPLPGSSYWLLMMWGYDVIKKLLGSMGYYTVPPHPPPGGRPLALHSSDSMSLGTYVCIHYTYIRANCCSFRSYFAF